MPDSVPQIKVQVEGVDLAAQVESIDVEDNDRAIDKATIVFDSAASISAIVREQTRVKVTMGWSDEGALLFDGLTASVTTEAKGQGGSRVTLTAYDLSCKLHQTRTKDRTFIAGTLTDALTAIVADYPDILVGQISPDPTAPFTPQKAWTKRSGQSDWQFIVDAASDHNARAFVEVNDNVSKFYFVTEASLLAGAPMGVLHYCPGGIGPLITFDARRVGSGASPSAGASVSDPTTGAATTSDAPTPATDAPLQIDGTASPTVQQAATIMAGAAGQPADARPNIVLGAQPSAPDLVQRRIKPDPTRILGYAGEGMCQGTIKLRAKGKVTIQGLAPWIEGDWYVRRVNHVYTRLVGADRSLKRVDRSTYQTRFTATR